MRCRSPKSAQASNEPIELLVENAQFFKTYFVAYHDGEKNSHLERVAGQPDILDDILKPLTPWREPQVLIPT